MSTGIATCVDFMISLILCLSLCGRGSFKSTRSVIRTVIIASVRNGLLTIFGALLEIVTLACLPGTLAVFTVNIVVVKVYVNSYLALLNARRGSSSDSNPTQTVQGTTSRGASSSFWSPGTMGGYTGYSIHLHGTGLSMVHHVGPDIEAIQPDKGKGRAIGVRFDTEDEGHGVPLAI